MLASTAPVSHAQAKGGPPVASGHVKFNSTVGSSSSRPAWALTETAAEAASD